MINEDVRFEGRFAEERGELARARMLQPRPTDSEIAARLRSMAQRYEDALDDADLLDDEDFDDEREIIASTRAMADRLSPLAEVDNGGGVQ